jgi:hypothetical protein
MGPHRRGAPQAKAPSLKLQEAKFRRVDAECYPVGFLVNQKKTTTVMLLRPTG